MRITFDNDPFAIKFTYVANILQSNLRGHLINTGYFIAEEWRFQHKKLNNNNLVFL